MPRDKAGENCNKAGMATASRLVHKAQDAQQDLGTHGNPIACISLKLCDDG